MMNSQQSMPLREQAIEALQESTTMLEVACNLLEQGNKSVSVSLMAKANALDNASRKMPARSRESDKTAAH
jgi:hypothetical protein